MKKTIAILTVLAAPLAIAAEMPTVYGKINKAYVNTDQEQDVAKTRTKGSNEGIVDVANSVSRIGFKGEEQTDMGALSYKLEMGLNSTGSTAFSLRHAEATMKSKWGALTLGQTYSPMTAMARSFDPLLTTIAAHGGKDVDARVEKSNGSIGFTARSRADGLTYTTPSMMGLTYTISQDRDNSNTNDTTTTVATHTEHLVSYARDMNGMNLSAFVGYDMINKTGTKDNKEMVYGLGLSKDMLTFNVAMSSSESTNAAANSKAEEIDRMFASAAYMMGKNTFSVSYQTAETKQGTTTNQKVSQIALGLKHNCTKNIDLNLTALQWKLEDNLAGLSADDKKNNGNEATLIAAGIQVKF